MSRPSTFVLVPGAWHGGWVWHPVAQRLRAAGHGALALTLPGLGDGDDPTGLGMEDAVSSVVDQVLARDLHDVVLVGHSWGGYPVTGAAHRLRERVSRVVFFSAAVPRRGSSMNDEMPPEIAGSTTAAVAASARGTLSVPFEAFAEALMQGEPEVAQRLVFDLLTPMPGGYMLQALDVDPVTSLGVPVSYVLAADDHALARPGHEFAARVEVEPVVVPGTHEALLTHPDDVAQALLHA